MGKYQSYDADVDRNERKRMMAEVQMHELEANYLFDAVGRGGLPPPPMLAEGHFLPPQYFEVGGQNFGGEAPKFRRRRRRFRKILGKFSKNCCLKMQ